MDWTLVQVGLAAERLGLLMSYVCSSARGQRAGGAAAVADGSSCRPEDEPGPGPGAGPLLPVSHPPLDQ